MARARNLKPALFKNEVLGVADPLYTILFEGLWVLADREGRLEDRPMRIKAEILPYRDGLDVPAMLEWLRANKFIIRYEVDGAKYIQVLNFGKHQNPHKNETPSEIPAPDDGCTTSEKFGSAPENVGTARADSLSSLTLNPLEPDEPARPKASPPAAPSPKVSPKSSGMRTFDVWLRAVTEAGERAIPGDHAAFLYAERIGLPREFLRMHWLSFKLRYSGTSKKYTDWRRTFHNSVKGNWFKLWFLKDDEYVLTTTGKQAEREFKDML